MAWARLGNNTAHQGNEKKRQALHERDRARHDVLMLNAPFCRKRSVALFPVLVWKHLQDGRPPRQEQQEHRLKPALGPPDKAHDDDNENIRENRVVTCTGYLNSRRAKKSAYKCDTWGVRIHKRDVAVFGAARYIALVESRDVRKFIEHT